MNEFVMNFGVARRYARPNGRGDDDFWPLASYETIRTISIVPITLIEFRPHAACMPLAFVKGRRRNPGSGFNRVARSAEL